MIIKKSTKLAATKQEYPDMTFEEIQAMVKRKNEEARKGVKK